MKRLNHNYFPVSVVLLAATLLSACTNDRNSPGYEYMPDMYRSPAVEAYVDYGMDPFHFGDSTVLIQRNTPSARMPVPGTIAFSQDPSKVQYNLPYQFEKTDEGYELSATLISPLAETEDEIAEGKVLYDRFCDHCHGGTGKGDGPVVEIGNHPPPGAYDGALKDLPEGKMFHSITYGKGVMGPHAGLLNKEERWKVIAYIKILQSGGEPAADEGDNTSESAGDSVEETAQSDNQ